MSEHAGRGSRGSVAAARALVGRFRAPITGVERLLAIDGGIPRLQPTLPALEAAPFGALGPARGGHSGEAAFADGSRVPAHPGASAGPGRGEGVGRDASGRGRTVTPASPGREPMGGAPGGSGAGHAAARRSGRPPGSSGRGGGAGGPFPSHAPDPSSRGAAAGALDSGKGPADAPGKAWPSSSPGRPGIGEVAVLPRGGTRLRDRAGNSDAAVTRASHPGSGDRGGAASRPNPRHADPVDLPATIDPPGLDLSRLLDGAVFRLDRRADTPRGGSGRPRSTSDPGAERAADGPGRDPRAPFPPSRMEPDDPTAHRSLATSGVGTVSLPGERGAELTGHSIHSPRRRGAPAGDGSAGGVLGLLDRLSTELIDRRGSSSDASFPAPPSPLASRSPSWVAATAATTAGAPHTPVPIAPGRVGAGVVGGLPHAPSSPHDPRRGRHSGRIFGPEIGADTGDPSGTPPEVRAGAGVTTVPASLRPPRPAAVSWGSPGESWIDPDPVSIADLVNEALIEQARRNGVDLV